MPRHGVRFPVKRWGNLIGRITASLRDAFAPSKPATSSHFTFGFSARMAFERPARSFLSSGSLSSSGLSVEPFPPVPLAEPSTLTALRDFFSSLCKCFFKVSARARYSSIFALTSSLAFSFFSSTFGCILSADCRFCGSGHTLLSQHEVVE